ncbi:AAA family ATPase, partial [bacterium]|nr:AAA family ATPase [bacterium]
MTQPKSSITINRLVVMAGHKAAYDQRFHKGVNIIRSAGNSTGKSTIMDFIFFVLGGDIGEWTDEAIFCDYVIAEISFSNKKVTLKREIGDNRHPPIYMYEGVYDEALENSLDWLKFSHRRSNERESFSQAFFRLLGYPENKLSTFANITIHELLRLVYCDQLTAVNHIFKHQDFDPEEMRLTVGEFLLGVDDLDLHGLRLQLREEEKELANLTGRLKATKDVLIAADLPPEINEIRSQIEKYGNERDELRERINSLESPAHKVRQVEESEDIKTIRKELTETKTNLKKYLESRESLVYEIEDSTLFINSIKERLTAL